MSAPQLFPDFVGAVLVGRSEQLVPGGLAFICSGGSGRQLPSVDLVGLLGLSSSAIEGQWMAAELCGDNPAGNTFGEEQSRCLALFFGNRACPDHRELVQKKPGHRVARCRHHNFLSIVTAARMGWGDNFPSRSSRRVHVMVESLGTLRGLVKGRGRNALSSLKVEAADRRGALRAHPGGMPAMSGPSDFPPACDPVHGRRTAGRPTDAAGLSRRAPFGGRAREVTR